MYNVGSISNINNIKISSKKAVFKGSESQTNPQIEQLNDIKPDFDVKTPMPYSKTDVIDFPYGTKAHCYKLSNGQKVIIVPQEGETVLRTYVNTGSMNEPDKIRGISHYIEHNLFNGSKGLEEGDFFKQVNKMGASTNASTGFAETNYYISSNLLGDNDLENKIKLQASMIESPLFALEKLEKEKGIVNSEINMITSDPDNIAINKMIKNLYGIKSASSDLIGGTTDNITNLTRDDVVNYYNNNYFPSNMVTVITGDVNPEDTIKLISKHFTSKRHPNANRYNETLTPIDKTVREDIISDKATASTIVVGFNGPTSDNTKDRVYTEALAMLLSQAPASRIKTKLKPLNAECIAEEEKISTNKKDGRTLILLAQSTEENSEKVLKAMFNEIGNIANNPPSEKEMQIIKKSMLKSFADVLEDSFATNNAIGTSILENNQAYLNNYEKIVNEMTAEDLVEAAKKYYDTNRASVAVVHPSGATKDSIIKNYNQISFTGASKEAINLSTVKEYNAANNYRVITVNSKTNNVEILFKLDTDSDIKSRPSAHIVLSELLNEGSMFRNQETMDSDLAQQGIVKGFSARNHGITCAMGCDSSTILNSLQSIKEVIDNPRFTQEDFEHVKSLIKDNIETREKSAFDKLDCELFKGLPKGYSKEEILKDLETLTLEDVKQLHAEILKDGKGIISVAAPFDKKPELKGVLFNSIANFNKVKEFNILKEQNKFEPIKKTKVLTDTDFKNQAEIVEAYKFKINDNIKDYAAIKLMNIILGGNPSSRLFMDLREKEKLAYHVKSSYSSSDDIGVMALKIGTTTDNKETGEAHFDNVKKSIEGFNRHIHKIMSEKVTDEELQNAKLSFKNSLLNSCHSSSGKVSNLTKTVDTPYGINRTNMLLNEIDKITAEDIYNAANYIFSNKPTYSIVATEDTLKANQEFLKSLEN